MKNVFAIALISLLCITPLLAENAPGKKDQPQREPTGVFDLQFNTVSPVSFPVTNDGTYGLDKEESKGAMIFPRGSENIYVFAGGFFFGTMKWVSDTSGNTDYKACVERSYSTYNGRSEFTPGRISDGDDLIEDEITKYRVYFSTDFQPDGTPNNPEDGENWPLWKQSQANHFPDWLYAENPANRNSAVYAGGPQYISDEDIFCTYKDTDLSRHNGGKVFARRNGKPLRLQVEQTIFTWNKDSERYNQVLIYYKLWNMSQDTLFDSYLGAMVDPDLGPDASAANNDRATFYFEDSTLATSICWTDEDRGEVGYGPMAITLVYTPAVDGNGYLRNDRRYYQRNEQCGLKSSRIGSGIGGEDDRLYNYMSSGKKDSKKAAWPQSILSSAGPFTMLPGQHAEFGVLLTFETQLPIPGQAKKDRPQAFESIITDVRDFYTYFYGGMINSIANAPADPAAGIEVWPNPATDRIRLRFAGAPGPRDASIIDMHGREVARMENYTDQTIDVSGLPAGMYMVVVPGNAQSAKFIVE
ncbi:MAG: T9SS type A sorting domain-containing protein [Candidatus Kapaibacterium sp.]